MARKKGSKNLETDLKAQQALEKKIECGKTHQELADEEGVHKATISRRIQKAMSSEEIQGHISQSRDRVVQMLSRCDDTYHRILTYNHPSNFTNQFNVARSIYKTFGVIQDEPTIQINNIVPIKVTVENREYTIALDPSASETGEGV